MKTIDSAEVQKLVERERAQVVEVLPEESYEQEHISGAISIPLKGLTASSAEQLDPSRPVIAYCNDFL